MKRKRALAGLWVIAALYPVAAWSGGGGAAIFPAAPDTSFTGVAVSGAVSFSSERFDENAALDALLRVGSAAPRVVPFRRKPLPAGVAGPGGAAPGAQVPAPETQSVPSPEPLAPALATGFAGLPDSGLVIPPDTMGASGKSQLLETLNSDVAVFDKSTGARLSAVSLDTFWNAVRSGQGTFDPRALYDHGSGRFVSAALAGSTSSTTRLLLAVSLTDNALGAWNKFGIAANSEKASNWADFDGLGVDDNNVYVSANMFNNGGLFQYSKVWVFPKAQLVSGTLSSWTEFADSKGNLGMGFTVQPAHTIGPSGGVQYFVHEGDNPPVVSNVGVGAVIFSSGIPTWTNLGHVQVASYPASIPGAPQPSTSLLIDTGDTRLLNAVYRNGALWTTHTVANAAGTKTEAAWYKIDPGSATLSAPYGMPLQQGRIADPVRFHYYPSIAVNATGDVALGFSGSSSAEYVGAYYTARRRSDPDNTMRGVGLLKSGLATYTKDFGSGSIRWGDYSATCVDPSDNTTFWTLQEYAAAPASTWATWWGSFRVRGAAAADFDGDGRTDFSIWRPTTGQWWIHRSSDNATDVIAWGSPTDNIVAGDFDGDGKTDAAIWRSSTAQWWVRRSLDNATIDVAWGAPPDIPVPGDYDGDGKTDIAVWRPSTGEWRIRRSSDNAAVVYAWGSPADIPVPGDYDGDGKTDIAVWRPSTGEWWVRRSSDGGVTGFAWGSPTDIPVPGDYDGDGKTDIAVWRPSTGEWWVRRSSDGGVTGFAWGSPTDVPAPGDYDGDGKTDIAVWRPSTGEWWVRRSSDGGVSGAAWGSPGDIPIRSRY